MRKIFYIFVALFFYCTAYTQDSTIALSQFQQFSSRNGVLLKTELHYFGNIKSIYISKIQTTDVHTGEKATAVRIAPYGTNSESMNKRGNFYIDIQDMDSVLSALKYFLEETKSLKSNNAFTFSYSTSNDVQFSCSYNTNLLSPWSIEISQLYQQQRSVVPGTAYWFNKRDIEHLIGLIKVAVATPL